MTPKFVIKSKTGTYLILQDGYLRWVTNPKHARKFDSKYAAKRFIRDRIDIEGAVYMLEKLYEGTEN
jgi:hypothetical protein